MLHSLHSTNIYSYDSKLNIKLKHIYSFALWENLL